MAQSLEDHHVRALSASYGALQPHKALAPHERHLARPDSLVHRVPAPNMTLYHEMLSYEPPNFQDIYRGGGLS